MGSSQWWRFDKADRIGTEVILAVSWLIAAGTLVGRPVWRWIAGSALEVRLDARALTEVDVESQHVTTAVDGATTIDRLIALVPGVLATVVLGVGVVLLIGILRRVADGRTFEASNATRWRVLAVLGLAAPVVIAYVTMAVDQVVADRMGLPLQGLGVEFQPMWILLALVCAAVGQAFADGARQREDLEGLI